MREIHHKTIDMYLEFDNVMYIPSFSKILDIDMDISNNKLNVLYQVESSKNYNEESKNSDKQIYIYVECHNDNKISQIE